MTPEQFVEEFDKLFLMEKKRIAQERVDFPLLIPEPCSLEFGMKSGLLNRELRGMVKELEGQKEEEAKTLQMRLKWAYAYWWNRFHLLEKMAASSLGYSKTKKNMRRGGETLKKLISGEIHIDKIHPEFKRLIETLNNMKVEDAELVKESGELLKGE